MRWLILLLLIPVDTKAQTNDGFFLFSMMDTSNHWVVNGEEQVMMEVMVGNTEDMTLPVARVGSSEWMAVRVPVELLGQEIMIRASRPAGNMQEVMELKLTTASPGETNGCYRCMVGNIIFSPARVVIDMPHQPESWELLPRRNVTAANTSFDCFDLSVLQPFVALGKQVQMK